MNKINEDKQHLLISELDKLLSEGRNPNTMDIDLLSAKDILIKMNDEDQKVALAVRNAIDDIAKAVDKIVAAFANNGRLIYLGAGTSGRLGILDAVECPPTFSVDDQQVIGVMAGGDNAFKKAVEGAEDNPELAVYDLKKLNLSATDVLVGIAASGRTPYVIGGLEYAKQIGATTVGISCNPGSAVLNNAEIAICASVGPEVLTGSTRLKSGTAQKLILNMLTTASMIRSGKIYQNLMVDVHASNEKLHARAVRIVMQATECDQQTASSALKSCKQQVKPAILHILTGLSFDAGNEILNKHQGFLRLAIEENKADNPTTSKADKKQNL